MKPTFTAAVSGDTLELRVYGPIGAGMFGEGVTSDNFDSMLQQARGGSVKRVHVRINSPGGSAYEGLAIKSQLAALTGVEKTCSIEGLAASAGSLIAMGCDKIRMATGAALMIHEASARFDGPKNASDLQKVLNGLEALNDGMASVYAERTGMSKAECRKLMAAETWLTPEQAVAKGFANEVEPDDDDTKIAAAFDLDAYGYRNVPAHLLAADVTEIQQPEDAGKDNTMNEFLALIAADIGLTANAEPASVTAAVRKQVSTLTDLRAMAEVSSNEALIGAFRAHLEAAKQVPALQAQVAEQAKAIESQKLEALIAADKADPKGRKLTPALEQWIRTQPMAVVESYLAVAHPVVKVESTGQPAVQSVGPTAGADANGVVTHDGKAYEALSPAEKHNLRVDNPEMFTALRDNWVSRGEPKSREQRASA